MEETPLQEILALEAQLRAQLDVEAARLGVEEEAARAAAAAELAALEAELAAAGERLRVAACAEGAQEQATELGDAERRAAQRAAISTARLQAVLRRHLPSLLPGGRP